jgi:lysophospholipase L1-like esterase
VTVNADRRVFFIGDSFVVGVGDPERRGWVGRLAERSDRAGLPITVYNLGVRHDTSEDVLRRWADEVAVRRGAGSEERLVVSFGVNDTTSEVGRPRVPADRTVANLDAVIRGAGTAGLPLFVVGPPPVAEPAQNRRIAALDERFRTCCTRVGVPYVAVHAALAGQARWMDEVERSDGAHPGAAGYALLAELVAPVWLRWIGRSGGSPGWVSA